MTAGLGLGGLALAAPNALANQPFTTYAFAATGAPTQRTMPDRLAEVKNVVDFGADPSGSADSTSAIQAAIDWTAGANRGTIFFPLGSYKVSAPLTFNYNGNLSIAFVGAPGAVVFASPAFNDFVFKRSLVSPNNTTGGRIFQTLLIQNGADAGGGIQLGSTDGGAIRDCGIGAHVCVTTEDSAGNSSQNILIENCTINPSTVSAGNFAGSHSIIIGGSGAVLGCDMNSADTAFRIYGKGLHVCGCRTERCNTAFLLGLDSAGTNQGASGFSIVSGTGEGCGIGFHLAGTCSGFVIGYGMQGHDSSNSGVPVNTTNSQYGLKIDAGMAQSGVVQMATFSSWYDQAGIAIANASNRTNVVFLSCSSIQSGSVGGVGWSLPTNAYTALLANCNIQPIWTFAQLPTGGNVFEGDEFDISDSTVAGWSNNVTVGGGTNHVRVRYNGTNWTVMGI